MTWHERDGLHRLFPDLPLTGRTPSDGAPGDDAASLAGLAGPIALTSYHAYRLTNVLLDGTTGRPLAGYGASLTYAPGGEFGDVEHLPQVAEPVATDADGRLGPGLSARIGPEHCAPWRGGA
jgi:hypothetical protein